MYGVIDLSIMKPSQTFSHKMRAYILSTIIGTLLTCLALAIFAAIVWLLQLANDFFDTFALLAFGTGCLTAGITIGRIKKQGGLVKGFKVGVLMLIPLIIVTLISGNFTLEFFLGRFVTAVLCGSVGGVIGVNKRQ